MNTFPLLLLWNGSIETLGQSDVNVAHTCAAYVMWTDQQSQNTAEKKPGAYKEKAWVQRRWENERSKDAGVKVLTQTKVWKSKKKLASLWVRLVCSGSSVLLCISASMLRGQSGHTGCLSRVSHTPSRDSETCLFFPTTSVQFLWQK